MKIGILGTGIVGQTIGSRLIQNHHQVMLGARSAQNEKAAQWVQQQGEHASQGTFADAARFGEILFNCTAGMASLEVLQQAGPDNLPGKILVDVSNPLDFSRGMPPVLSVCNEDSLAERIQRTFPQLKVVKTLNTMTCAIMVKPDSLQEEHNVFISGNETTAKATVTKLLQNEFGWKSVIDLGDITSARGTEMFLPLWLRLYGTFQSADFNIKIVRK